MHHGLLLSKDYFEVPDDEIKSIESVLTIVNGNIVYAADEYEGHMPELPPILPQWSPVKYYGSYYK